MIRSASRPSDSMSERLGPSEGATNLILFRLAEGRQRALGQALAGERFRPRVLTDFADLARALAVLEDAAVLVELAALSTEERREFAHLLTGGTCRPWLVGLSVLALQDPAVTSWVEAGVDWVIGPDEPALLLARHLERLQDAHVAARENALLHTAVRTAPHGIMVVDMEQADQPLVFVNEAFETITGYPRAEALGRNCRFLQQGLLSQPATEEIRQTLQAGTAGHVKLYNRRKDGALFVNELNLAPFRDRHGRLTHYLGIMRDVTLRESAMQRLEASPLKIWQLDSALRTEFVNGAWSDIVPDPAALPPPDLFEYLDSAEVAAVREAFSRALRTGRSTGVEARLRLPSGESRWHHFSVAPRLADDGQVFGLIGAAVDISTSRAAEERANRRLQQLSLQSLLMRRLLGGAVIDSASAGQAVEIVAEILGAEEVALVGLDGADSPMTLRRHWSVQAGAGMAEALAGRRFAEVFPFSAVRVMYADSAIPVERSEAKRFAGQGAILAYALRRENQVVGCLLALAAEPSEDWVRLSTEQLKSVGSLLHFAI